MSDSKPVSDSTSAAKDAADATRKQLTDTLEQIEDKLNVPKRIGEVTKKAQTSFDKNPVPFIVGGVAAVAGIVGLVIHGRAGA